MDALFEMLHSNLKSSSGHACEHSEASPWDIAIRVHVPTLAVK